MPAPTQGLDWALIRERFETTDVSVGALRREFGLASDTTITRRRDAEGWKRNGAFRAAAVVAHRAAEERAPLTPPSHGPHTQPSHAPPLTPAEPAVVEVSAFHVGERGRNRALPVGEERIAREAPDRDHNQPPELLTPVRVEAPAAPSSMGLLERAMFDEQARAIKTQLREGERLIRVAGFWLEHLEIIASADLGDMVDQEKLMRSRAAMLAINTDKDSTTSLAKSFTEMMVKGIAMVRQALGMDLAAAKGAPEAPSTAPGARDADARSIFQELPVEALRALRDMGARRVQAALLAPHRPA